jgi:acyl-CoA dehydrogenase
MDFSIPKDLLKKKETARKWVREELIPLEKEHYEGTDMSRAELTHHRNRLKELGLWSLGVPKELGGQEIGWLGMQLMHEEAGYSTMFNYWAFNSMAGNPPANLYACLGNEYQMENYLYPVMSGEKQSCFGLTEAEAGSDPSQIRTTAVKDGDHWVINGSKKFISGAHQADFIMLYTKTSHAGGKQGFTGFLVDSDTPGYNIVKQTETLGQQRPSEIIIENCRIPDKNVLGEVGHGFAASQDWLTGNRLATGGRCVGAAERCLQGSLEYAQTRSTFGAPIATRQAIQWMLADMAVEIECGRYLSLNGSWKMDQGMNARTEAHMVRLYTTEMAFRAADRALQIHGGIGVSLNELPYERIFKDMRTFRITEGASEIQRMAIARNLLRGFSRIGDLPPVSK